jgi:hypothetical protein
MKKDANYYLLICFGLLIFFWGACKEKPVIPTLSAISIANISATSITVGGMVTDDGRDAITARGVCWSTRQDPTIADNKSIDGRGIGSFTSILTALSPGVTYYLKAYATNSVGTAYGSQLSATTLALMPTITTAAVSNVTTITATSGGNIVTDGGSAVTARGVCWATTQNPTTSNSKTSDGSGTGSFASNLTGLTANTTYYLKSYATNSAGTTYGNEVSFKTENIPIVPSPGDMIIDHRCTKLANIPSTWVATAKKNLHIAYGHTSHGSQLTDGMTGLVGFKGAAYSWNNGGAGGALDLHDYAMEGDLGAPDRTTWATLTRTYLAANRDVNVIIWSWCGQASTASAADINTYLNLMTALENDFKNVKFVYMTGHLDGTGLTGNLHLRNEQIRNYCKSNNKILYDFADIECYNPDGVYFGGKKPNDACDYDTNGDGSLDGNWATEWQKTHIMGTDWYNCSSAHSQPLNANQKAYAAWWLWTRIAGWDGN